MNIVLRSEKARGVLTLAQPRYRRRIHCLALQLAQRHRVTIYQYANAGNHLHLLIKVKNHDGFKSFLRHLTGRVAMMVSGARKGKPVEGGFWQGLAYSRLVSWGREFEYVCLYVIKNIAEGFGAWDRKSDRLRFGFAYYYTAPS